MIWTLATSDWNGYTVFSVIAGISLLISAFLPDQSPGQRIVIGIIGVAFAGYGIWTAQQTTGTYVFPVEIFVIPFVVGIKVISNMVRASNRLVRGSQYQTPPVPAGGARPDGVVQPPPRVRHSPTAAAQLRASAAPSPAAVSATIAQHAAPPARQAAHPVIATAPTSARPNLIVSFPAAEQSPASEPERIIISYDDLE
jgi:hypothetical protein